MIFVTVGAQMPFDRLVRAVDQWAERHAHEEVFAQIGETSFRPSHMRWTRFLDPGEFRNFYSRARGIVAHAGTGSIITALQLGKPIVIMPRRAGMNETRTDHQVATAERFARFPSIGVAWNETELARRLEVLGELEGLRAIGSHASPELIEAIRNFVDGESGPGEEEAALDAPRAS